MFWNFHFSHISFLIVFHLTVSLWKVYFNQIWMLLFMLFTSLTLLIIEIYCLVSEERVPLNRRQENGRSWTWRTFLHSRKTHVQLGQDVKPEAEDDSWCLVCSRHWCYSPSLCCRLPAKENCFWLDHHAITSPPQ